jgi:hypothetical protein
MKLICVKCYSTLHNIFGENKEIYLQAVGVKKTGFGYLVNWLITDNSSFFILA